MTANNASTRSPVADRIRRIAHLDLPGAGQVYVSGDHCYIGHIPRKDGLGTTIVNIADPANPKVVSTVMLDDPQSHSHKVRVVGDVMIVNHEQNNRGIDIWHAPKARYNDPSHGCHRRASQETSGSFETDEFELRTGRTILRRARS